MNIILHVVHFIIELYVKQGIMGEK